MTSVFAEYSSQGYPFQFAGRIHAYRIAGGVPSDPKVAENYIRTKLAENDDIIRNAVAQIMAERGITAEEALERAAELKHLNGFCRDEDGLYIKGMQLKACLKEAAHIRWPDRRWVLGKTLKGADKAKGTLSFFPEHVFVKEHRLHLGVSDPTGVSTRFVHTWRGSGIQNEEYVEDAEFDFHVESDYPFTDEDWALLWTTAEHMGIGASRGQGYGEFEVTAWKSL